MARKKDKAVKVRGFFRLQIGEGDKVVGDSGWLENTVTVDGLTNYIAASIGAVTGSKLFSQMCLASAQTSAVNSTQLSLTGEFTTRKATTNTVASTGTFQATAAWASSEIGATQVINAIGLYNVGAAGTLGCGQTFAQSTWQTNQAISATYQLRFA